MPMFDNSVSDSRGLTRSWNFGMEEKNRKRKYDEALASGTRKEIRDARDLWEDSYDFLNR